MTLVIRIPNWQPCVCVWWWAWLWAQNGIQPVSKETSRAFLAPVKVNVRWLPFSSVRFIICGDMQHITTVASRPVDNFCSAALLFRQQSARQIPSGRRLSNSKLAAAGLFGEPLITE